MFLTQSLSSPKQTRHNRVLLVGMLSALSFILASCAQADRVSEQSSTLTTSQALTQSVQVPQPRLPSGPRPSSGLVFVPGDRIVWLGDSITAAHTYGRYVETFFLLRRPDLNLTFINAGIGGHSALNGLNRVEQDVLALKPSVVVVNFGMNDAGYPAGSPHAAFIQNMDAIIARLRQGGVQRIIWVEPTPAHIAGIPAQSKLVERQRQLERYVAEMRRHSVGSDVIKVQWHDQMKQALNAAASKPDFKLIPDRIHPSAAGHAVMAVEFLRQIGANLEPSVIESTLRNNTLETEFRQVSADNKKTFNVRSSMERSTGASVDISTAIPPVPMLYSAEQTKLLANQSLEALRGLTWRVKGLEQGARFTVKIDGFSVGTFSGAELAKGVDVMPGDQSRKPLSVAAKRELQACALKDQYVFLNDFECLFDMLYQKDQLRMLMRPDRVRDLPDFGSVRLATYTNFTNAWIDSASQAITEKALQIRRTPHILSLTQVR
ncbi:SGNH/GDSL hydrolase family protein [Zwartia vadi]|uniref:SGNH/GDSL hydrolase family protein n=1 Tax=Zwartia vadi TaxID=3058168 RepID=UPI0025B58C3B|nr:SGNH/GDSL hydrolase family protein [Zwartia vadi]MDN3986493.1 SGNH/GDSL hydrolase family protein [Zwartia vadi]